MIYVVYNSSTGWTCEDWRFADKSEAVYFKLHQNDRSDTDEYKIREENA